MKSVQVVILFFMNVNNMLFKLEKSIFYTQSKGNKSYRSDSYRNEIKDAGRSNRFHSPGTILEVVNLENSVSIVIFRIFDSRKYYLYMGN